MNSLSRLQANLRRSKLQWKICKGFVVPLRSFQHTPGNLSVEESPPTTFTDGNNYRFVDQIKITVRGGKGGDGCISYETLSPGRKKPSGGSGGKGGNVFLVADKNKVSLRFATIHFNAEDGRPGGGSGMSGRNGDSVFIKVPCGTIVSEEDDLDLFEVDDDDVSGEEVMGRRIELNHDKEMVLVALGGKPGLGNKVTISGKNRNNQVTPGTKTPGQLGQHRTLQLELKTIADVGLVGYPNAGKSSLLRALSNATPKVAAYPFTTLYPTVGIVQYSDLVQLSVADIPGLIEGAHENRGLGHDFLKHIERTKVLLFVLDVFGDENAASPAVALKELMREIELYDDSLLDRPKIVFLNKYDVAAGSDEAKKRLKKNEQQVRRIAEALTLPVLCGSALKGEGIGELAHLLRRTIQTLNTSSDSDEDEDSDGDSVSDSDSDSEGGSNRDRQRS